jgi:hypothetical protein
MAGDLPLSIARNMRGIHMPEWALACWSGAMLCSISELMEHHVLQITPFLRCAVFGPWESWDLANIWIQNPTPPQLRRIRRAFQVCIR